ncbi:hypothetical protein NC652_013901 [Populus alba x Populus x berolinensis]|nr:hypothetical protein NC652_013901 [Populus alba x Populus x berolinensis]
MLVMEVLSSMRKLQRCLDEFGEHYSKLVVGLAVAIALLEPFLFEWPFMITPGNLEEDCLESDDYCMSQMQPLVEPLAEILGFLLPVWIVFTEVAGSLYSIVRRIGLKSTRPDGGSITLCLGCSSIGLCFLCKKDVSLFGSNRRGVWSWSEGINYAPALAAATVGIVLAQRATATAIAVACVLTAKGCHTWCSVFYQVSPKNFPVRAKCSPRINLYISSLPSIHFEFPSTLVNEYLWFDSEEHLTQSSTFLR